MSHRSNGAGAMILRLIVGLALLAWPRVGSAARTWAVIAVPPKPGEVHFPKALAVDAAGDLYVAEDGAGQPRLQKRDAQGVWSVVATAGTGPGQVSSPRALAVDGEGNLHVADNGIHDNGIK